MAHPEEPTHVPALDGLRGIAVLLVVVFHTLVMVSTSRWEDVYVFPVSCGFIGVDLFFVLSGFLITGILIDLAPSARALTAFYARRGLRTMPLYYAVVALSLLVLPRLVPPDKAKRFADIGADVPYYLLHLSNVAIAKAHAFRHPVLDISWSLAIEEQFYLIWPVVVLFSSLRTVRRIAAGAIVAALALRTWLSLSGSDGFSVYLLTPCRMDALAVGASIALAARDSASGLAAYRKTASRVLAVAAPLALVALYIDFLVDRTIIIPGRRWPLATFGFSAIAVAFGALLVLTVTAPREGALARVLSHRVLVAFGKYSYAIYLFHLPLRAVIRDKVFGPSFTGAKVHFNVVFGSELLGQLVFHAVAAFAALGAAWVSYHVFEARFLALKRRFPLGARRVRPREE